MRWSGSSPCVSDAQVLGGHNIQGHLRQRSSDSVVDHLGSE